MIIPRYYEDLSVLHENTMPTRAYYIPASKRMDSLLEHREESDRMQLLNGNWKFRYFESIYDVKDEFYELGYDVSSYDVLKVPSVWQMAGYDNHQYTNIRYPFPFDPPYVPQDIPCGAYVHTFEYQRDEKATKACLNFEGVDSCFYVWLNGKYVGYSQVSHATSEFDVTSVIEEGDNTIAVLVLKWCDGTYLEDQDKFRMSGIFRDVYLLNRPEQAVRDYRVTTDVAADKAIVKLEVSYDVPIVTKITIEDKVGTVVADTKISTDGVVELEILNPELWNTESPYLYTLIIETTNEVIVDYIGLRTIEIKNKILYFNGEKIKFRGVNRHDFDPETGFTISIEQLKKDIAMMKQHNFNAIRCSHYPNAPYFYQLCDKYGFLVIDEADIEAHGPFEIYYKDDGFANKSKHWNERIADNPAWEEAIVDRVQRMVQREKNRPCVVIWSMGNESAYGCNFEVALKWTKLFDPERLTHYESARYRNYDVTYNYDYLDLYSRMYPEFEEIEEYLTKDASKPFLLVEYCHSMGNGPGDLEDYFELIQKNDLMCGGFVWEWCDHAISHGTSVNGQPIYYYGGDHGEVIHDSNFCVDGLVYPDRTPHTGLLEYKNVYRPARVVSFHQETKELTLHNYMDFDDLKDYAEVEYEITCDGVRIASDVIPEFSVEPHEDATIKLDIKVPDRGRTYLKIIYKLKKALELIPTGYILGFDEIKLENEDERNQTALRWMTQKIDADAKIDVTETDDKVICKGNDFIYTYSKKNGLFENMVYAGRELLNHSMEINIWRAPTDNDMYVKLEWKRAHYNEAYARAYKTVVQQSREQVVISSTMSVVAATVQRMMDVRTTWVIDNNGGISTSIEVVRNTEFPELPRFGIRLFLNKELDNVSYYGMGPTESYCDKHRAASHGLYCTKVAEIHEDYICPQENGSHFDCDYVELTNGSFGFVVAAEKTFSFNASVYTQEELEYKAHSYQLEASDSTVLCIDYALNGIGSNSCGPKVMDKYCFDEEKFTFAVKLIPYVKG